MKASRPHIVLNEAGTPIIAGTQITVSQLVLGSLAYGWTPSELKFNHPQLSLEQIHSALAYYREHQAEFDQKIQQELEWLERFQAKQNTPSRLAKLLAQRRIS